MKKRMNYLFNPLTREITDRRDGKILVSYDACGNITWVEFTTDKDLDKASFLVHTYVLFVNPHDLYFAAYKALVLLTYQHTSHTLKIPVFLPDGSTVTYGITLLHGLSEPAIVFSVDGNVETARLIRDDRKEVVRLMLDDLKTRVDGDGESGCLIYHPSFPNNRQDEETLMRPYRTADGRVLLTVGNGDGTWSVIDSEDVTGEPLETFNTPILPEYMEQYMRQTENATC